MFWGYTTRYCSEVVVPVDAGGSVLPVLPALLVPPVHAFVGPAG